MNRFFILVLLILLAPAAPAQENDLAAERARLANQRIAAEARAREEQNRLAAEREQAAAELQQAAPPAAVEARSAATETPAPSAQTAPVTGAPREAARPLGDVDRILEQIRTLGELRDAGYVTEAEFERIKQRILDGTL